MRQTTKQEAPFPLTDSRIAKSLHLKEKLKNEKRAERGLTKRSYNEKDGRKQTKKAAFPQKSSLFLIRNIRPDAAKHTICRLKTYNLMPQNLLREAQKGSFAPFSASISPCPKKGGVSQTKAFRAFCQAFKRERRQNVKACLRRPSRPHRPSRARCTSVRSVRGRWRHTKA